MRPILLFFADPEEIAERVAAQMGIRIDEALLLREQWDRIAVFEHRVDNNIPRRELN
jgi:hypothetical protein